MKKAVVKNVLKWIWLVSVAVFVVSYAIRKKNIIISAVSLLSWQIILAAAFCIFIAKLCLVINSWIAANKFSIQVDLIESYRLYNLSQLGKYIPGSIWQFVGRIGMLRERDVPGQKIRDSLLAEHLWVVASAGILGSIFVVLSGPFFFTYLLNSFDSRFILIPCLALLIFITSMFLYNRQISKWIIHLFPPCKALPVLFCTWFLMGMSLWVTLHPIARTMPNVFYTVGIYALGYAIGFLIPFAPAGLGVREALLCCALSPYMDMNQSFIIAGINRIIYFSVEIIAAMLSGLATNKGTDG